MPFKTLLTVTGPLLSESDLRSPRRCARKSTLIFRYLRSPSQPRLRLANMPRWSQMSGSSNARPISRS